ncbi:MAG: hypothetical protein JNM86_09570 [Phycisphaerae bacterium]|nr:hypothetical protein [Phycisphaerae bacterium]MBN8597662.1 hypothetical protein [Planctomycetota bacterium]
MILAAANIDILIWVAILLGVVLSGSLVILTLRKKVFAPPDIESDPGTLMEQMRRMEKRGEISAEEFDRVRRKLVEKAAGAPSKRDDR